MELYMRHWEVTVRHAKDCADFLMASRDALKECSSVFRYLERDIKDRLLMHFSSGSGGAPWVELEVALRRFAVACPTESLVNHTTRLSEAFVKLKVGLLDVEDAFGLYVATGPTSVEGHRRRYRYLVEFKTRLLEFKNDMEGSHAAFLRALSKRRQDPPAVGERAGSASIGAPAKESSEHAGDSRRYHAKKVRTSSIRCHSDVLRSFFVSGVGVESFSRKISQRRFYG
jgi:hypothetical protein